MALFDWPDEPEPPGRDEDEPGTLARVLSIPLLPFVFAWDLIRLTVTRGLPALGRVLAWPFRAGWAVLRGIGVGLGIGVRAVARVLAWPLRIGWRGMRGVGVRLLVGLRVLGRSVAVVLRLLGRGLAWPFRIAWVGLRAFGVRLAIGLRAVGRAVGVGVRAVARVLAWPLRIGWRGMRGVGVRLLVGLRVLGRSVAVVLRLLGRGLAWPFRIAWVGLRAFGVAARHRPARRRPCPGVAAPAGLGRGQGGVRGRLPCTPPRDDGARCRGAVVLRADRPGTARGREAERCGPAPGRSVRGADRVGGRPYGTRGAVAGTPRGRCGGRGRGRHVRLCGIAGAPGRPGGVRAGTPARARRRRPRPFGTCGPTGDASVDPRVHAGPAPGRPTRSRRPGTPEGLKRTGTDRVTPRSVPGQKALGDADDEGRRGGSPVVVNGGGDRRDARSGRTDRPVPFHPHDLRAVAAERRGQALGQRDTRSLREVAVDALVPRRDGELRVHGGVPGEHHPLGDPRAASPACTGLAVTTDGVGRSVPPTRTDARAAMSESALECRAAVGTCLGRPCTSSPPRRRRRSRAPAR